MSGFTGGRIECAASDRDRAELERAASEKAQNGGIRAPEGSQGRSDGRIGLLSSGCIQSMCRVAAYVVR